MERLIVSTPTYVQPEHVNVTVLGELEILGKALRPVTSTSTKSIPRNRSREELGETIGLVQPNKFYPVKKIGDKFYVTPDVIVAKQGGHTLIGKNMNAMQLLESEDVCNEPDASCYKVPGTFDYKDFREQHPVKVIYDKTDVNYYKLFTKKFIQPIEKIEPVEEIIETVSPYSTIEKVITRPMTSVREIIVEKPRARSRTIKEVIERPRSIRPRTIKEVIEEPGEEIIVERSPRASTKTRLVKEVIEKPRARSRIVEEVIEEPDEEIIEEVIEKPSEKIIVERLSTGVRRHVTANVKAWVTKAVNHVSQHPALSITLDLAAAHDNKEAQQEKALLTKLQKWKVKEIPIIEQLVQELLDEQGLTYVYELSQKDVEEIYTTIVSSAMQI